jgi:hypothetical protein
MNSKLIILFILIIVFVSDVKAQESNDDIIQRMKESSMQGIDKKSESLRGLKEVQILIEALRPDIEEDGLKISQIQTDVELKLRLAGINIYTETPITLRKMFLHFEMGAPYLYVNVNSNKNVLGFYSVNISVALKQNVYLPREMKDDIKKVHLSTITWVRESLGSAREAEVANYVRDIIKDKVDEFINDYLSVNPK